jgi:uncharacterized membrane protein
MAEAASQLSQTQRWRAHQKITRTAILTALCVALGYLFLPVPNLEMITMAIFLSGILMGPMLGALIGFLAETIYSISNPMGFPPPPLLIAQVLSMALVGLAGGMLRPLLTPRIPVAGNRWLQVIALALIGATLTLIYDLLTTLSFPLTAGFSPQQIQAALILGIPYVAVHIGTNAAIFGLLVPVILKRLPIGSH